MAAALLAMEDFNNRDNRIVKEMEALTQNCTVQFDLSQSMFVDTSALAHSGSTMVMDQVKRGEAFPCAFAGPYFDLPAQSIASMAAALTIPHNPHRGYNYRLSDSMYSPFTSMAFPDMAIMAMLWASIYFMWNETITLPFCTHK
ncbi:expressed unknown protein [Seminavis robusta]|uniref:Uncharacterized protein n=1 Tax=Seminavis robusta TaxID=568900 RepID=A0A9N8EF06_9STRA|nr:expressed unknown protein [Seminavis robusta]|eukprot:Sro847_g210340.1 n/a (144) ;mRNA; f:35595-36026